MKNCTLLVVLLALSSTVACDQVSDDGTSRLALRVGESAEGGYSDEDVSDWAPSYSAEDLDKLPGELRNRVRSACSPQRQIAQVVKGASCPMEPNWDHEPLIGDYCVYSYMGPGVAPPLDTKPSFEAVQDDCLVVRPQRGSALEPLIGEDVRNAFAQRVGVLERSDLRVNGHSTEHFRSPITVVVVDTVPRSRPLHPNAEHGENLARLIQTIGCPDTSEPSCAVSVDTELGLPRIDRDGTPDYNHGGYIGTFTDLATGIINAVDNWDGTGHLIINLSVGWEFDIFDEDHAGTGLVRAAAQYAHCHGALLVASAGNDGGLCQEGLLAPAVLAEEAAPSSARCGALGVPPAHQELEVEAPLVHAIGGLGYGNEDMPGARVGGRTPLMATASHGMGGDAHLTTPLTGTSVSAAAVSAAAALVWSYNPQLTRVELMDALYEGAEHLNFDTDFAEYPDTTPVAAKRLSICNTMKALCSAEPSCNLSLDCGFPQDHTDIEQILIDAEQASNIQGDPIAFTGSSTCSTMCGITHETGDANDCERLAPDPAAPYVDPQPDTTICSICGINGVTLTGSLDQHVQAADVTEMVLMITDPVNGTQTRYTLGRPEFSKDHILRMEVDAPEIGTPRATYTLIGLLANGRRFQNNILARRE